MGEDYAYAARFTQCNPLIVNFPEIVVLFFRTKKATHLAVDGSFHSDSSSIPSKLQMPVTIP